MAKRFVRLRVVPGGAFDERADGLTKADDVRNVDKSSDLFAVSLAGGAAVEGSALG